MFLCGVCAFQQLLVWGRGGVRDEKAGEICIIARRFKHFHRLYSKEQHKITICIITPVSNPQCNPPQSHLMKMDVPISEASFFGV